MSPDPSTSGRWSARRLGMLAWGVAVASVGSTPGVVAQDTPRTAAHPLLLEAIAWYTGVTGRVDDARAAELLRASPLDPLTRMWRARVHSRGRMGFERDEPRARAEAAAVIGAVRDLAASGDAEAMFLMGTAYDEGLGAPVDYGEALRWYRRAADRGHVLAAHNVGNVHRDGRGVPVDHAAAARWWLRAAHAGDVIPQLRLGEAYEAGRGLPASVVGARIWFRRAAEAGSADAEAALRRLDGRGPHGPIGLASPRRDLVSASRPAAS